MLLNPNDHFDEIKIDSNGHAFVADCAGIVQKEGNFRKGFREIVVTSVWLKSARNAKQKIAVRVCGMC